MKEPLQNKTIKKTVNAKNGSQFKSEEDRSWDKWLKIHKEGMMLDVQSFTILYVIKHSARKLDEKAL